MNPFDYLQLLRLSAPETIVTVTLLVVLSADLTVLHGKSLAVRFHVGALLSVLGCLSAACLATSKPIRSTACSWSTRKRTS